MGVDEHYEIMQLVLQNPGRLLARMKDYYADAEFDPSELRDFVNELAILRAQCRNGALISLVDSLAEIAEQALREQLPLVVIAD